MTDRPDVVVIMTDQERAAPPYESDELREWRRRTLVGARWFEDHGVSFMRHYTGSLACVPSRPTLFTGQYPDVHGVTQTDGLGKMWNDSRMRWLRPGEVPTLGHWFRAAGYDTHYQGKWHMSHADLLDPATRGALATNDSEGAVDEAAVKAYLDADPLGVFGFSGWIGPEPHGPSFSNTGFVRDPLIADRVVAWLQDRYARRRASDAEAAQGVFTYLTNFLAAERTRCVPDRNQPWPYAERVPPEGPMTKKPPPPARLLRKALQQVGMHPDDQRRFAADLTGRRALVVATNHGRLDIGKPTGVFASEMTVPYYAFLDAGMEVDVASPAGGEIPVDPQSLKPVIRTEADDRFLVDNDLRQKVTESRAVGDLDMADYDIVYLAGGWGAAYDFGFSPDLGAQITEANRLDRVIGGVCHGPLGLLLATGPDGAPLVKGRRVTGVTDKQVQELGIESTPHHPETELRRAGAVFEGTTRFRDAFANHWVVDGNLVTGQNQNAAPMVAREMMQLVAKAPSGA